MKHLLIVAIALVCYHTTHAQLHRTAKGVPTQKLKPTGFVNIDVPEPSDISYLASSQSFYVVSDNGLLFETSIDGKVLRQADHLGVDFEGVHATDSVIYVVDEMTREIIFFDKQTLKPFRSLHLAYGGGRNKGFESITYIPEKDRFILFTEKDPCYLFEVNKDFVQTNKLTIEGVRDISAVTYHAGKLWLLSDEDRTVFRMNPQDYSFEAAWVIPVVNPEGIAIVDQKLYIVSDDMERLYTFDLPTK